MTNGFKETTLPDWGHTRYVSELDGLNVVYRQAGSASGSLLRTLCRGISGFCDLVGPPDATRPCTDDGYVWFWGLRFCLGDSQLLVLMPWKQNWEVVDGPGLDRSIAACVRGSPNEAWVRERLNLMRLALQADYIHRAPDAHDAHRGVSPDYFTGRRRTAGQ